MRSKCGGGVVKGAAREHNNLVYDWIVRYPRLLMFRPYMLPRVITVCSSRPGRTSDLLPRACRLILHVVSCRAAAQSYSHTHIYTEGVRPQLEICWHKAWLWYAGMYLIFLSPEFRCRQLSGSGVRMIRRIQHTVSGERADSAYVHDNIEWYVYLPLQRARFFLRIAGFLSTYKMLMVARYVGE